MDGLSVPGAESPGATVYLAQCGSGTERAAVEQWINQNHARMVAPHETIAIAFPKHETTRAPSTLALRLDRDDDPLLVPLRVAWLPRERADKRRVMLRDLLLIGDPRNPRPYAKWLLARYKPARMQVLQGKPARASELLAIWEARSPASGPAQDVSFARFVVRRATLALERAQSRLLGPQYKMPRLVREEIRASARFRDGLQRLAEEHGKSLEEVSAIAEIALKELASGYTPLEVDINMNLGRFFYRQGYAEQLDYDMSQVDKVRQALTGTPGVVLPSHRSNLDAGVMPNAFHELGLPKTNTLGGINMSFWPLGYLMRRSGVIFIRRDIRSDPIYRWLLKEYIGYLMEKSFSLEWYIEGTRSRTGKSLPPKLGLLKYVTDAYREGRSEDVALISASMTYDQLNEAREYAGEASGRIKQAENLGWFYRFYRSLRGRYGRIYVRFGEPISLREVLGTPEQAAALDEDSYRLALQKLAFEVSARINKVTPVTGVSLITLASLSSFGQALTFSQLRMVLDSFVEFTERNAVPTTNSARQLVTDEGLRAELQALIGMGVMYVEDQGPEPVYTIHRDQHVTASFYRNSIIHHFLTAAISEVALAGAASVGGADHLETFWATAYRLRDVLKFDFFFLEKGEFRNSIMAYLDQLDPAWQGKLAGADQLLRKLRPLTADSVLRSFLEAYYVVARCVQLQPELARQNQPEFLRFCGGTARQYLLQRRIRSAEASSQLMFKAGLELARHRGLLDTHDPQGALDARTSLNAELQQLLSLIGRLYVLGRTEFQTLMFTEEAAHERP